MSAITPSKASIDAASALADPANVMRLLRRMEVRVVVSETYDGPPLARPGDPGDDGFVFAMSYATAAKLHEATPLVPLPIRGNGVCSFRPATPLDPHVPKVLLAPPYRVETPKADDEGSE